MPGDDGRGLVPGSFRIPRQSFRGASLGSSHRGSPCATGSEGSTKLEQGGPTKGSSGVIVLSVHHTEFLNCYKKMYMIAYIAQWNSYCIISSLSYQNCIPQYYLGHWKRVGEFVLTIHTHLPYHKTSLIKCQATHVDCVFLCLCRVYA